MVKPIGGSPTPPSSLGTGDLGKGSTIEKTSQQVPQAETKAKKPDPEASKQAQQAISNDPMAMMQKAQLQKKETDVQALVQNARGSKLDGVEGISKSEYESIKNEIRNGNPSSKSLKWLEKNHPHLHAAVQSDLDYNGYVGTAIGSLNMNRAGGELKQDAAQRNAKLDQLPPYRDFGENGLPKKGVVHEQGLGTDPDTGNKIDAYKTGTNTTKISGDALANISDAEADKSRKAQKDMTVKMSGIIGTDVSNPPSVKAARAYFQGLADRGASPDQIRKEYGQYLKTFYRHPGGVDWKPPLDPKNLDANFNQQPVAKDGKRLIDCEGYSALTENVLGGLKKNGQPMFDILHGASNQHVTTAVFPHGGDIRKGFIVDNENATSFPKLNPQLEKDFAKSSVDAQKRFLMKQHMEANSEGSPNSYGSDFTNMKSPFEKVKVN